MQDPGSGTQGLQRNGCDLCSGRSSGKETDLETVIMQQSGRLEVQRPYGVFLVH